MKLRVIVQLFEICRCLVDSPLSVAFEIGKEEFNLPNMRELQFAIVDRREGLSYWAIEPGICERDREAEIPWSRSDRRLPAAAKRATVDGQTETSQGRRTD
jgi:hypothetical protein